MLKPIRGRLGVQTDQALYLSLRNIYYLDFDTCVWKDLIKSIFCKNSYRFNQWSAQCSTYQRSCLRQICSRHWDRLNFRGKGTFALFHPFLFEHGCWIKVLQGNGHSYGITHRKHGSLNSHVCNYYYLIFYQTERKMMTISAKVEVVLVCG